MMDEGLWPQHCKASSIMMMDRKLLLFIYKSTFWGENEEVQGDEAKVEPHLAGSVISNNTKENDDNLRTKNWPRF